MPNEPSARAVKSAVHLTKPRFPVLKTLFGGAPKWQSPDADIRLTAVAELAADAAQRSTLITLATSDADHRVRAAAVAHVNDTETLSKALADSDASVRDAAAKAWANTLGGAVTEGLPLAVIAAAVREDSSDAAKAVAAKLAASDLTAWLASSALPALKLGAIASCGDVPLLDKLHHYWRDHDKRLGKACHDRVLALQTQDKSEQEADVLLAQMQAWSDADEVPLSKLIEAQRAWGKLSTDATRKTKFEQLNASLQQRMQSESMSRRLHEALAMQVAGLSLKSKRVADATPEALEALAAEATAAQSSPAMDAGLAQQLQAVHAAVASEQQNREKHAAGEALLASMPQRPAKPAALRKPKPAKPAADAAPMVQIETASAAAPGEAAGVVDPVAADVTAAEAAPETAAAEPVEAIAATDAASPEVLAAPTEAPIEVPVAETGAEPVVASTQAPVSEPVVDANVAEAQANYAAALASYGAASVEWKSKWDAWTASVDAATKARFESRLAAATKPEREAKPERAVTPRAEDADIAKATESLTKLAELIAAGDVRGSRSAASKLYQAFTAKRYPKIEESRLHELDGEVKRLESWLKWSDGQARDALFARIEALKTSPLPPEPLAKEIRDIQEEWKALDKKNGGAPKPKWDKFNAECKAAYAPAKAHFDALRKQRTENASGREKVIADMHALAEEAAAPAVEGQNRDWASLERRKSALFDQWKKAGSVANSAWKSLDEKLDAALGKLDTALDGAREPELSRRRKLILRAEELSKASPSREVTEEAIAIQRRWTAERIQNAPHLRRKDEQKMWDDFKKHTDAVFKARDAQRDSMKAQFSEATKARFEVIDEVKALANGDDAKAIDAAMNAARTKWRNLPFVDRDKARDLDRKFDDAVMAAKRRATVLSRGSVIEAMKASLEKIAATEGADKTAAALVIDAELIAGVDSPAEIATARRVQQLKWLSERRQLPTAPDAKIQAIRTLLGAFNATGAKVTLGERERLTRVIEAVGAA
ncbi:MAG: DUF349 domain-containing protein [Betaproteobacteria bacterium]|nr:MAG: DUF349 domain-containing protein [Betaproteobacteria bacterium]